MYIVAKFNIIHIASASLHFYVLLLLMNHTMYKKTRAPETETFKTKFKKLHIIQYYSYPMLADNKVFLGKVQYREVYLFVHARVLHNLQYMSTEFFRGGWVGKAIGMPSQLPH
jgi:hypothetical protein